MPIGRPATMYCARDCAKWSPPTLVRPEQSVVVRATDERVNAEAADWHAGPTSGMRLLLKRLRRWARPGRQDRTPTDGAGGRGRIPSRSESGSELGVPADGEDAYQGNSVCRRPRSAAFSSGWSRCPTPREGGPSSPRRGTPRRPPAFRRHTGRTHSPGRRRQRRRERHGRWPG